MPQTWNLPPIAGGDATVERWYAVIGTAIARGDPLALVRTELFAVDLPATFEGQLVEILAPAGTIVSQGQPLAHIAGGLHDTQREQEVVAARPLMTPLARTVAARNGLDVSSITGSGARGRIVRADVQRLLEAQPTALPSSTVVHSRVLPGIQPPLTENATAVEEFPGQWARPIAMSAVEVDWEPVFRAGEKMAVGSRPAVAVEPVVWAAAAAARLLLHHPRVGARWSDAGVIVPRQPLLVIDRGGQQVAAWGIAELNAAGLARRLADLPVVNRHPAAVVIHSSAGRLWNGGELWAEQTALLWVGAPAAQATAVSGAVGMEIQVRRMSQLALWYDARVLLGYEADAFLMALKRSLEEAR
ncbi:MAG: E3 binding domain-containing protein [Herpetosiphon sp.]